MKCFDKCQQLNECCQEKRCRMYINYCDDYNCTLIAVRNNKNKTMIFEDIGRRLKISSVRAKQITDIAIKKIKLSNKPEMLQ